MQSCREIVTGFLMPRVCIHGHFYQPPREDPWTGSIHPQSSALPFADWNQRITAECYRSNGRAAILDSTAQVSARVNTYKYISFNFGATLLRWMHQHAPDVIEDLVEADRSSQARLGHGNAVAQAYHHSILPLANARDKQTEVLWGVRDFEHRFGRTPEGMWLAETAVDTPTLEVLARHGVRFVILAPRQAQAVRGPESEAWAPVDADSLDTARPYTVELPSGARIAAFFYSAAPAQGVAFGGWLDNGEKMAHHLAASEGPLVHFATDGESYGHHHRHGEMGLAYCIRTLSEDLGIELTNYARELTDHPPTHTAKIHEASSWSCAHGIGRWSTNCGCSIDPARSGQQEWRPILRGAMNSLRDELAEFYIQRMAALGEDPWDMRDRYVHHLLGSEHGVRVAQDPIPVRGPGRSELLKLLELQRHALMMFTSCGWFFDDPGGLEAVQILRYAHRAICLHQELGGRSLEPFFVELLDPMKSVDLNLAAGHQLYADRVAIERRL